MSLITQDPLFLVIDLFCGAGGTTEGFAMAGNVAKVIACVNHDHYAILSHWANHPEVKHFEEDIRTLELSPLVELATQAKAKYPSAKLILWASLECTNHSRAKGGLARDPDSRTLADHLERYVEALNPDILQIENVVEFLDWGPSRVKLRDGKAVRVKNKHGEVIDGHEPIPETKGQDFERWCIEVCALGYVQDWRQLNSADYGAFTSRNRLFGVFAKDASLITWPESTHSKAGKNGLPKWKAVREKIDFSDQGYSIFSRGNNPDIPPRSRKDLSENTLERVYAGCIKHYAGGKDAFMVKYHGGPPRTNTLDVPLTVIDTQNRHAFVSIYHGNGDNTHSIDGPAPVIASADVTAAVFLNRNFKTATSSSVDEPAGAITTNPKLDLVTANSGRPAINLLESDSPATKKLKHFMALYGIADIKMRMLRVDELLRIQGFPDSYNLLGTQSDQKKFIGNSVVPHVVKAWIEAMAQAAVSIQTIAA